MRFPILLLFFGLLAFSCKKDPGQITPYYYKDTFSATIEGSTPSNFVPKTIGSGYWASNGNLPTYVSIGAFEGNGVNDGRRIGLILEDYDGTKTSFTNVVTGSVYQNSLFGSFCLKDCSVQEDSSHNSVNGAIHIDSFDKTLDTRGEVITGTFQFDVDDSTGKYSIRDGHFSVGVQK
jgi:hypothetical protein